MPFLSLFHKNHTSFTVSQIVAISLSAYGISIAAALLAGNTILLGAAISLFLINPFLVACYAASQSSSVSLVQKITPSIFYVVIAGILSTLLLFVITDIWNPDNFAFEFPPTLWRRIMILITFQRLWFVAAFLIAVLPACLSTIYTLYKRK
jgi:hypothetical protein